MGYCAVTHSQVWLEYDDSDAKISGTTYFNHKLFLNYSLSASINLAIIFITVATLYSTVPKEPLG